MRVAVSAFLHVLVLLAMIAVMRWTYAMSQPDPTDRRSTTVRNIAAWSLDVLFALFVAVIVHWFAS